jgi:hypothetical protein
MINENGDSQNNYLYVPPPSAQAPFCRDLAIGSLPSTDGKSSVDVLYSVWFSGASHYHAYYQALGKTFGTIDRFGPLNVTSGPDIGIISVVTTQDIDPKMDEPYSALILQAGSNYAPSFFFGSSDFSVGQGGWV